MLIYNNQYLNHNTKAKKRNRTALKGELGHNYTPAYKKGLKNYQETMIVVIDTKLLSDETISYNWVDYETICK